MPAKHDPTDLPQRQFSLLDSVCIIVGIIIGVGIFETTPLIARSVGDPSILLVCWVAGGLLASLIFLPALLGAILLVFGNSEACLRWLAP